MGARYEETDLRRALFLGGVPEDQIPRYGGRLLLPWLRFAAACVLYRPPVEEAPTFAEYGGLPTLPGDEAEGEPILGVQTKRQRVEAQKYARVHEAVQTFVAERMWEHRKGLPDDYREARYAVMDLYFTDLMELQDRVLEEFERDMNWHPPSHKYYIEFDPKKDKDKDVKERLKAIRKREGPPSKEGDSRVLGTPGRQSDLSGSASPKAARGEHLLQVMCELLLRRPGLTPEWLASELGLSIRRVQELQKEGRELLGA
ncbi:MAG: hypothetical protein H0W52_14575 [Rubrobacteraceae bacterium]|nr:hypothetical protein [Rubrobacteraceae bacterium]